MWLVAGLLGITALASFALLWWPYAARRQQAQQARKAMAWESPLQELEGVRAGPLFPDSPLPALVQPDTDASLEFLLHWLHEHRSVVQEALLVHGALMFRGFEVQRAQDFERVALAVEDRLSAEYRGTSPRKVVPGTEYVFCASELPSFFPIPQHIEMSFVPEPPRTIFFGCMVPNRGFGGETALCDFREVYRQLSPPIRAAFDERGVLNIRNYHELKRWYHFDPWQLKGWRDVFETSDAAAVERECKQYGWRCQWGRARSLRVLGVSPASVTHPETGDRVWFNHAGVFHFAMLPQELARIWQRSGDWVQGLLLLLSRPLLRLMRMMQGELDHGMHAQFGDGTPIPDEFMEHVRSVIWRNMVFPKWQRGDVVVLDNLRVSHGRQPYRGRDRTVYVAWSQPRDRFDPPPAATAP